MNEIKINEFNNKNFNNIQNQNLNIKNNKIEIQEIEKKVNDISNKKEEVKFEKKYSKKEISKFLNDLNSNSMISDKLKFKFNEKYKTIVIEVIDIEKDKVIRQFPTKEFFKRLEFFKNVILPGLIVDEKF